MTGSQALQAGCSSTPVEPCWGKAGYKISRCIIVLVQDEQRDTLLLSGGPPLSLAVAPQLQFSNLLVVKRPQCIQGLRVRVDGHIGWQRRSLKFVLSQSISDLGVVAAVGSWAFTEKIEMPLGVVSGDVGVVWGVKMGGLCRWCLLCHFQEDVVFCRQWWISTVSDSYCDVVIWDLFCPGL